MSGGISTVLIVDDSRAIRALLRRELTAIFCGSVRLFEAGDGGEALTITEQNEIDLIFLDINMPGKDGIATLSELKARGYAGLVIMVTADGARAQVQKAVQLGARGYIVKPFSRAGLAKAIERASGRDPIEFVARASAGGATVPVLDMTASRAPAPAPRQGPATVAAPGAAKFDDVIEI